MTAAESYDSAFSRWLADAWARQPEVRSVRVEGAKVSYRAWNLDDTTKPGLLLSHGYIGHGGWWDHIAPHFLDQYRVVAPDLTGMGDSEWRPEYDRKQYAREFLAVARDAGLDRVVIASHSFSAISGLLATYLGPDLVERVVVIDALVFDVPQREVGMTAARRYPDIETTLARYKLMPPGRWPIPPVLDYVARGSCRATDDGAWTWKFDPEIMRVAIDNPLSASMHGMHLPVDYIYGEQSEIATEGVRNRFLAGMPDCGRMVGIPLSHHHVMIEQPVGLVAALKGVLAQPHPLSGSPSRTRP